VQLDRVGSPSSSLRSECAHWNGLLLVLRLKPTRWRVPAAAGTDGSRAAVSHPEIGCRLLPRHLRRRPRVKVDESGGRHPWLRLHRRLASRQCRNSPASPRSRRRDSRSRLKVYTGPPLTTGEITRPPRRPGVRDGGSDDRAAFAWGHVARSFHLRHPVPLRLDPRW
jgi:hypothetical protein